MNDCIVSEEERLVLSLGLNFVPPPLTNKNIILKEAVDKFTRAVRIKNTLLPHLLVNLRLL